MRRVFEGKFAHPGATLSPYNLALSVTATQARQTAREIVSKLGELPACTVEDVTDAWAFALAARLDDFESTYYLFCKSLVDSAGIHWRSEPLPLAPVASFRFESSGSLEDDPPSDFGVLLWKLEEGEWRITVLCELPAGYNTRGGHDDDIEVSAYRLFVSIRATCSDRFFRAFCERVVSTLGLLLDSILTFNDQWFELEKWYRCKGADVEADKAGDQWESLLRLRDSRAAVQKTGDPSVGEDREHEFDCPTVLLLRECLIALFANVATKKDSMQRRVKNAVRLLVEAKRQSDNAIGLALSVSAIEAMLCRRSENVAAMFAENMAVLLEPDPGYRAAAERWCKELYDKRSGVLHGTNIECSVEDLRRRTRLA